MRRRALKPKTGPRLSLTAFVFLLFFTSAPAMAEQLMVPSGQVLKFAGGEAGLFMQHSGVYVTQCTKEPSLAGFTSSSLPKGHSGDFPVAIPGSLASATGTENVPEDADSKRSNDDGHPVTKKFTFPEIEAEVGLSSGYREDEFDWNIAGDASGENPNVLSELTWDDLQIFQFKIGVKTIVSRRFYLRGSFGYGWIFDGDNQDSDFAGDNRTLEFSRSNNSADDGDVLDASLGVGYQFRIAKDKWKITPLVGFSYHEQNLTLKDGEQTVSKPALAPPGVTPPPLGPFAGLDSKYEAEWTGPWLGVDVSFQPIERLIIRGTFEYHWADYEAEANWNLRTDLAQPKSFAHDADGEGIVLSIGLDYAVIEKFSLNVTFDYQDWSTDPGTDKTYFADGTTAKTQLNEVNWQSYAIMAGASYRF
jgi:outer membrane protease